MNENLKRLLFAYDNVATARFSDWGGAQRRADQNMAFLLSQQSEYTLEDVANIYFNRA